MTATFETLMALDRLLAERGGHHPLTPWWVETLRRWYEHPTATSLVARVGRGGTKSTTSVKVSLNEVLFGRWPVPPGERHWWVYVSVSRDEAAARLLLIESFLRALGEQYSRRDDTIELARAPLGWKVLACQVASVSGPRAIGYSADELTKWRSADRLANPAREVIASSNAMAITHPRARKLLISSPLGLTDYHFERFSRGDTDDQIVAQAPTWIANPTITEQQTHDIEPDERIWRREYAAVPQAGSLSVFEPEAIARAFQPVTTIGPPRGRVGVIDASSGRKDSWTFGIASWQDTSEGRRLVFSRIDGFHGRFWEQQSGEAIVRTVAETFRDHGVVKVFGDQRESLMLRAAFSRHALRFTEIPWTGPAKERAVSTVRRWLADGLLALPEHDRLREELLEFEERITPTGSFTFG